MKKITYPLPCKCFLLLLFVSLVFSSNVQPQIFNSLSDDNQDYVYEGKTPRSANGNVFMNVKDTGDVITTIPTQSSYWQGMTWDGNFLWCSEILFGKIYQVDPEFGTVIKSFDAPGTMIEGLAWDESYLWAMENGNGPNQPSAIYKIDSNDGSVVDFFVPFGVWLHGITYDGQYLWMVDFSENSIYKVNTETGVVLQTLNTPGESCIGLTWDGNHLWTGDIDAHKLYCLNPADGTVIYEVNSPHPNPRDLAWDGQYLWVMASQSSLIYQIDVGMITSTPELSQSNKNHYGFSVYPNPVTTSISISYTINHLISVKIQIYNSSGTLVNSFLNSSQSQEDYQFILNLDNYLAGVYYCVLQAGKDKLVRKIVKN